jgi:uncharacterized protein (DUF1330 family)
VITDGAEDPIDAIVHIAFDSEADMQQALQSDAYQKAHQLRENFMRETSIGIHSAVVDEVVKLV